MKEELIKLAKEKGFESKFLYNQPYKYSTNEDLRWFFWMTELQKWLREKHKLYIEIFFQVGRIFGFRIYNLNIEDDLEMIKSRIYEFGNCYNFKEALEVGLLKACELIKNKNHGITKKQRK